MTKEEVISQLESLIEDRKSFLEDDGDDRIFREDIKALERAIKELEINALEGAIKALEKLNNKQVLARIEEEIYLQALAKWGKETQINMAFEEMAELQKELCKSLRGKENRLEIAEEIADVEIMLGQMKLLFGIEEGVERHKQLKLQRLEERLKE